MSGCALKRWGTGTPCTREPDTAAKKEMAEKLAIMRAEREKQDTMWLQPAAPSTEKSQKQPLPLKYTSS
jgi:hypothetical protein